MVRRLFPQLFLACCLLTLSTGVFAGTDGNISDKLLQAFHKTFPDAQQVKWAETEDRYMVNFKQGEILTKVEYDKDGNFLNSLRYYSEKSLPVNILCRLQKKYADKKVFGVTEVTSDSNVEYYIKLEDAQNWITVKSNVDGLMQVVEKYKKAS
ncbi:MAG TPA: hypothetical protein VHE34_26385 [Puia sp.]|uniref:hypothetical protein n=1 Tax=Puia sp. TaxID=2045100 RepID=UPI002C62998A|nr:hypothetical protein [Puia sp.]HVU98789.1 hypothetical protein [Puia sp.]